MGTRSQAIEEKTHYLHRFTRHCSTVAASYLTSKIQRTRFTEGTTEVNTAWQNHICLSNGPAALYIATVLQRSSTQTFSGIDLLRAILGQVTTPDRQDGANNVDERV
jgi:hypothetical protein